MKTRDFNFKRGLYRSRNGIILGVCQGVADYLDFSAFWLRVIMVALLISTGFFPIVVIYFVAALLMKPEPVLPFESESDREFYESYTASRTMAIHRLKRTFDNLERRIRRMEDTVTGPEFNWDEKIKS